MLAFPFIALDWWAIRCAQRCVRIGEIGADPDIDIAHLRELGRQPPLSAAKISWKNDGHFEFPSPIRTSAVQNNTVYGRLFPAEKDWSARPTAILLHGWNAELCYRYMFPYLAELLRRERINVLTLELPYHMHRRPRSGPVTDFISSNLGSMIEASRQAVAEVQSVCGWLAEQGSSAGLWGFSLGAWLAGIAARAALDWRFLVLTTPISRMDRAIAELPFCYPIRYALQRRRYDLRPLNLCAQVPAAAPEKILLVQSRHDLFAPAETVEELWRAWDRPDIWRLKHGHISVLFSTRIMRRTVGWIRERLQVVRG